MCIINALKFSLSEIILIGYEIPYSEIRNFGPKCGWMILVRQIQSKLSYKILPKCFRQRLFFSYLRKSAFWRTKFRAI